MKKKKVCILSVMVIAFSSVLMQRNGMMNTDRILNTLASANVEALTQGESGGGSVDSVEFVTDTYSTQYLEDWVCGYSSGKDTRSYSINCIRSCNGRGLIPCSYGSWFVRTGTDERNCTHSTEVR